VHFFHVGQDSLFRTMEKMLQGLWKGLLSERHWHGEQGYVVQSTFTILGPDVL